MEVPEVKRLKALEEATAHLKTLLAEAMLDKEASCGENTDDRPEVASISSYVDAAGLSQHRACRLAGLSLSTFRYEVKRPAAPHLTWVNGLCHECTLKRSPD